MLALACGSIAFAQVQFEPVTPVDSAAKAAAQGAAPVGAPVSQTVAFASGSRWHLTVNAVDKFGLVITGASFQKSPNDPYIYVLHDGRMAEIFVPYHNNSHRYRDISYFANFKPIRLEPGNFPQPPGVPENGTPVREIIGVDKLICREMRDYLAWMNGIGRETPLVRYGQEVAYFSVLQAGNYSYIMEWTFRDDGTIVARAGSTGPKFDARNEHTEGHMHNFTWRLDIDLNGASANTAYWTRHKEKLTVPESTATDEPELISPEGSRVWDPEQFNTLQIFDARLRNKHLVDNGLGRKTSYELVPMRSGTARHSEPWTKADFWVTQYRPDQLQAVNGQPYQELPLPSLPDYLTGQSTINKDLVIWYTGSEHHENNSRDEDFNTVPVLWTGFELIPKNLFDRTPFYPNP